MIIFTIINFVLPLMLTCLVLVDDPPRCSECRKKIGMTDFENKTDEFNVNPVLDKYSKK